MAGGQRRGTAWDDLYLSGSVANAGQDIVRLLPNVSDTEKRGCTAIRVLYHAWYSPTSPGVANGVMSLDVGIGLVSDDAFSASAVPEADDADDFPVAGWVYRDRWAVMDSVDSRDIQPVEAFRDLRAQRKLDRSSLVMLHEASTHVGTAFTIKFIGLVRVLYKLP